MKSDVLGIQKSSTYDVRHTALAGSAGGLCPWVFNLGTFYGTFPAQRPNPAYLAIQLMPSISQLLKPTFTDSGNAQ